MWTYESAPGKAGSAPLAWPVDTHIQRDQQYPTLLVFVHPQCPCTRATIGELAILMAACQGKVDAKVLFCKPDGSASSWEQTDLWQAAKAIPGVIVLLDPNAQEAKRFSVQTSGHTLLYSREGTLAFSGGITRSRGHSGDNAGRSAIMTFLATGKSDYREAKVFGCLLLEDDRSPNE
jgi:hypothetical protein